jgi:phosphoribosylformylglycinamidine synthase subunit PurL
VGGLGLIDDLSRMVEIAWDAPGLELLLLGECLGWLGCSLYWGLLVHRDDGAPPPVDLAAERRAGEFLLGQVGVGRVRACHDLADGGLAVAAAEMCLASGVGAALDLPADAGSATGWWFGEDQGRYLVAVSPTDAPGLLAAAGSAGVIARRVGRTGGDALILGGETPISIAQMRATHEGWLPGYMTGDAA